MADDDPTTFREDRFTVQDTSGITVFKRAGSAPPDRMALTPDNIVLLPLSSQKVPAVTQEEGE
jgi:hypothetical protein